MLYLDTDTHHNRQNIISNDQYRHLKNCTFFISQQFKGNFETTAVLLFWFTLSTFHSKPALQVHNLSKSLDILLYTLILLQIEFGTSCVVLWKHLDEKCYTTGNLFPFNDFNHSFIGHYSKDALLSPISMFVQNFFLPQQVLQLKYNGPQYCEGVVTKLEPGWPIKIKAELAIKVYRDLPLFLFWSLDIPRVRWPVPDDS